MRRGRAEAQIELDDTDEPVLVVALDLHPEDALVVVMAGPEVATASEPRHPGIDAATGLLAGFVMPNSMAEGVVRLDFREWKTVAGVKLPSQVVATDLQGDFILDFEEISVNDVDPAVFESAAE